MRPYQEQYIKNIMEIDSLRRFDRPAGSFESWLEERSYARRRINALKKENISILSGQLFSDLDSLHGADEQTLSELEEFADRLMDWRTNLDTGIYTLIHDALLSCYRIQKKRDLVIKELYKLGMGIYYMRRALEWVDSEQTDSMAFQNEMVFTEASSYIRFFDEIEDEETKGYIIRSFANIALCCRDHKRRIAASARTLQIIRDPRYRAAAPGLPWERFLRGTHQQMSANRRELTSGDLTREELAEVLDSCYEVFRPEEGSNDPSVRWLWPYYEMEYSCGYVDLRTTMRRLEELILKTPYDKYDESGLYGNIQLPIYYGRLIRDNAQLRDDLRCTRFLASAYRKMMQTVMNAPQDVYADFFRYQIHQIISEYYEADGVMPYSSIVTQLMQRFSGNLYIRCRKAGDMMRRFAAAVYAGETDFFDDIPFAAACADAQAKEKLLLEYAEKCGFFYDFGMFKMELIRTYQIRNLLDSEYEIDQVHTVSGYDDLRRRPSTARYADAARGHHRWYDGTKGFPAGYSRMESLFRQMTDVAAVVSFLLDGDEDSFDESVRYVLEKDRGRFSPRVSAYLMDASLRNDLRDIMVGDRTEYYRDIYDGLMSED